MTIESRSWIMVSGEKRLTAGLSYLHGCSEGEDVHTESVKVDVDFFQHGTVRSSINTGFSVSCTVC